ncbi:unnamed protein product [Porites evermanni]|uniref:BTB domain-containing protein n=1 Tax=Porites evermanni TaxID=104178 RepID=A0ABN8T298_9CNID|nr:unnamed protein product [Porites evermanni]
MAAVSEGVSEPMTADHSQHCLQLTDRLEILRNDERFCDVIVEVKGKEFKVHKAVLAASSPFFLTLLESNMRESNEHLIKVELEEATASIMEDVLKYVYTGNVSVTEESVHNLIATADYLLLPGLKSLACDFLKGILATENCVFNYYFAERYQCMNLMEECRELIKSNFSAVMETDDFLNLDVRHVSKWVSSDDITVKAEEEVFKGIVKWVNHNKSEREKEFPYLFHQVRLNSVDQDYLVNELVKEELITTNNECLNFVLGFLKWILDPTLQCSIKPRTCLQTQVNGIFVCGGNKTLFYLPNQNIWYQLSDLLMEYQDHAAIQYRDKVYIFGNQGGGDCYMPSTNTWGAIQSESFCGKLCSLLKLDKHKILYAVLERSLKSCGVYHYDPVKSEWKNFVDEEKLQLFGACGVTDGCHLYVIGGSKRDDWPAALPLGSTKVVRIDPEDGNHEEVASMNEARHDAFGAAMNGKIYVGGGRQKKRTLRTCEMYDLLTDEWQVMPSLNVPRHSSSMVCYEEALYAVGGMKTRQDRELSVEMFDFKTNEWKKKSTIPVADEIEEERKEKLHYKACSAAVHKDALQERVEY